MVATWLLAIYLGCLASHLSKPPYSQELRDSLHYTIELEQEGTVGLMVGLIF